MRILIAEDDLASRKFLFKFLKDFGECDVTVNGVEALEAFMMAWDENKPYDLVCLDIMMPKMDGMKVLKAIRSIEVSLNKSQTAKIIMISALNDPHFVQTSFDTGCEAYASKPLDTDRLLEVIKKMGLLPQVAIECP